jgi:hypothetical protein
VRLRPAFAVAGAVEADALWATLKNESIPPGLEEGAIARWTWPQRVWGSLGRGWPRKGFARGELGKAELGLAGPIVVHIGGLWRGGGGQVPWPSWDQALHLGGRAVCASPGPLRLPLQPAALLLGCRLAQA